MKIKKPYSRQEYAQLAEYCNANNCHIMDLGEYLVAVENDPPPPPTKDEIRALRIQYRRDNIDDETNQRVRCMANGTWTEEREAEYLALDAEVTAYIEKNYPYPEESES